MDGTSYQHVLQHLVLTSVSTGELVSRLVPAFSGPFFWSKRLFSRHEKERRKKER